MSDEFQMRIDREPMGGLTLRAHLSDPAIEMTRGAIIREVIQKAAEVIAQRFIDDHGVEILKALDPQAVANLAIADSGRAVREALEKSIPREVQHHYHHDREVYKVGIFGGVRRVS